MAACDEGGTMSVFINVGASQWSGWCAPTTDVNKIIDSFHDYLPLPPVHDVWIIAIQAWRVSIFQRRRSSGTIATLRSYFGDRADTFRPFCHESDDKKTLRGLVRHYGRLDNPVVTFYGADVVMPAAPEKELHMTVHIKTSKGKTFALDMMPSDTIMDLKLMVWDMKSIERARQLLSIASRLLDDNNRTLSSYNIRNGSTIKLKILPPARTLEDAVRAAHSM